MPVQVRKAQEAATALGITLVVVEARERDYARAFAAIAAGRAGALSVLSSPILYRGRKRIVDLAARHRLPAICEWREFVADGGLMSYDGNLVEVYRRVASHVARILKGANPADLPVEQPAAVRRSAWRFRSR